MHEWGSHAKKLLIQKVDIYDRCPSLGVDLVTVLDCYMDVASNRDMNGSIPWDKIYLWCEYHGVSDREYYLDVIKVADNEINKWQDNATTT